MVNRDQEPRARSFFGLSIPSAGDSDRAHLEHARILEAVMVMKPKPSPAPLVRVGGPGDGGYLLPDDLTGITACFSPGVSNRKDFEDDLADRFGIASHLCDLSSDPEKFRTPLKPNQTFKKVWLDTKDGPESITLKTWISEFSTRKSEDFILQMDIEGAEYRNILDTDFETLNRFRIIVIELHRLDMILDNAVFETVLYPFFMKIRENFVCVHAHPNNARPALDLPVSKLNLPQIIELTFLRKDRFLFFGDKPLIPPESPHPFDAGRNVVANPPIFLSDAWFDSPRSLETKFCIAQEELSYYRDRHEREKQDAVLQGGDPLARSFGIANSLRNALITNIGRSDRSEVATDVALGKPFVLSSTPRSREKGGFVTRRRPSFFQTLSGPNEWIRIDLQQQFEIEEIIVENRSYALQDRAKFLICVLSDSECSDTGTIFPLHVNHEFLSGKEALSRTKIPSCVARFVTIKSLVATSLHFADLRIFGRLKEIIEGD